MSELKPCPFCGSAAFWIPDNYYGDCEAGCVACEAAPAATGSRGRGSAVITAWNTRPIEDNLRRQLDEANARAEEHAREVGRLRGFARAVANANPVCRYKGRCNSSRCLYHAARAALNEKGNDDEQG